MRSAILAVLLLVVVASSAGAVCPAHQPTIQATTDGKLRLCPAETDADGDPVGAGFYASCEARAAWGGGKTAAVTLTAPTAGTPVIVGFPAAKGAGSVSADCTNADGVKGAAVTSTVTFRRGLSRAPVLSE